MNLVSCDNCGVVLDKDKLNFPTDVFDSMGSVIPELAEWVDHGFVGKVQCPICKEDILGDKVV